MFQGLGDSCIFVVSKSNFTFADRVFLPNLQQSSRLQFCLHKIPDHAANAKADKRHLNQ